MGTSRAKKIVLYLVLPPLLFAAAIALVLFLYLRFHSPIVVDVTSKGFTNSSIEITEGQSIHIINQSNTVQVLCLGVDRTCDPGAIAPAVLKAPGVRLAPGASVDVDFQLFGTYNVTSTSEPGVNLVVTVNEGG
jgi:hypothetical protein